MSDLTKQEEFECEEFHIEWYQEFLDEVNKIQEDLSCSTSDDLERMSVNLMYVINMVENYIGDDYRKAYYIKRGNESAVILAKDMDDLRMKIDGLWDERECTVFEVDNFPSVWCSGNVRDQINECKPGREIKLPV